MGFQEDTKNNIKELNNSNTLNLDLSALISGLDEKLNTEEITLDKESDEICNCVSNEILTEDLEPKTEVFTEEFLDIDSIELEMKKMEENLSEINKQRRYRKVLDFVWDKTKFMFSYAIVSSLVFVILLGGVNYSAYSKIAYNFINPNNLKNSSKEIISVIDNSKIKVYADEDITSLREDQEKEIQENLSKDNVQFRETYFSPKKLVPLKSDVDLSVDIVPYDNRLIIPKIGKNIPLVDIDKSKRGLDYANLEDVFMSELEKGVIRYPGTSKPGEKGVSFIFGHSSNFPWIDGEYNDVFALLDKLSYGDEIIIYYNQKKYTYVIREKKVIKPGDIKILERNPNKKELSLMTCWPIGTTLNRLITFAELKEDN